MGEGFEKGWRSLPLNGIYHHRGRHRHPGKHRHSSVHGLPAERDEPGGRFLGGHPRLSRPAGFRPDCPTGSIPIFRRQPHKINRGAKFRRIEGRSLHGSDLSTIAGMSTAGMSLYICLTFRAFCPSIESKEVAFRIWKRKKRKTVSGAGPSILKKLKGWMNACLHADSAEAFIRAARKDFTVGKKEEGRRAGGKPVVMATADADNRGKFLNPPIRKKASPQSYIPAKLLSALGIPIFKARDAANA
jgi:hypothetical protein